MKKLFKNLALGLLLSTGTTTNTLAQTWVKTSAPDSIAYMGIRTFGKDTIYSWGYAGSYTKKKLASSFDGGQTWVVGNFSNSFNTYFVASPVGLHAFFSAVESRIEHTADGGITWQTMPTSKGYRPMGLLPNGKLILGGYLSYSLNISPDYISLGTNYAFLLYKDDYWTSAINPSTGRIIFGRSNGENQLGYSDDNGQTFTDISLVSLIGNVHSPLISYSKDNTFFNASGFGVRVSTDNGNTWTQCSSIDNQLVDMVAHSSGRVVIAHGNGKVRSSTDNGQTWSDYMNGLPDTLSIQGLGKTTDGKIWLTEGRADMSIPYFKGGVWYISETGTGTTSIAEEAKQPVLNIYPNPTNTVLNIDAKENTSIKIVNVLGAVVATKKLQTGNNTIDVSHLANGAYIIYDEKGDTVKFIKE